MDLTLLDTTLADLDQPAFRARQIWEWTARAAHGYDAMPNVPAALREQLAERVPFSTLEVEHEAHAKDGTIKALFRTTKDQPPPRAGRAPLAVPELAVGLPADLHVLRHGHDEVRAQPHGLRDPRPGAALPPHRGG